MTYEELDNIDELPSIAEIKEGIIKDDQKTTVSVVQPSSNIEIIGEFKTNYYGGFIKIIEFLSNNTSRDDMVVIQNGSLVASSSTSGTIEANMETLFGKNNFRIADPQNNLKRLKLCRGGDLITIVKLNDLNKYKIISSDNGVILIELLIPIPVIENQSKITPATLGKKLSTINIPLEVVATLIQAKKTYDAPFFTFILDDKTFEVVAIETTEEFRYNFKDTNEPVTHWKVFDPFPVLKSDQIVISIYEGKETLILESISVSPLTDIIYKEPIHKPHALEIQSGSF